MRGLVIPASPEYAGETGIATLVQAVADLQGAGSGLNLLGILPAMVDVRSRGSGVTGSKGQMGRSGEMPAIFYGLIREAN